MMTHLAKKGSVIKKHTHDVHRLDGVPPEYRMKSLRPSRTNLDREVAEGVLIEVAEKAEPGRLMNSKSEGGRSKLVRYQPTIRRI